MENLINTARLLETLKKEFEAHWVAPDGAPQNISVNVDWVNNPLLINYFHLQRPPTIQVFGHYEYQQLLEMENQPAQLDGIIGEGTFALLFCHDQEPPAFLLAWCADRQVKAPLIRIQEKPDDVISYLYKSFAREIVQKVSMHGVFLDIYGMGVTITGSASIGKSEIALEMISRGHKFIADDLVEFVRLDNNTVSGSCPEILQDMIEVRSLGILNIRRMYGNHVVLRKKVLNFIIVLYNDDSVAINHDRMRPLELEPQNILEVKIPVFPLQVRAGRNLAVLIEACVRSFLLRTQHRYDAAQEIINRQEVMMGIASTDPDPD